MKDLTKHKRAWRAFRDYLHKTHQMLPEDKDFDSLFGHFIKFFSEHGIEIERIIDSEKVVYSLWSNTLKVDDLINLPDFDTPELAVAKAMEILNGRLG